ncbi:hypothetical protein GIB67_009101 [Kingdonia uniflora]|uniref:dolichol kinase n=1 Tax=Kingdonia uniflora TaxID=39325 RepID=A0A7J7N3X0_9MAGN|nr:hypothetical protein GIB67_009101 [Kingdonia uniflora]
MLCSFVRKFEQPGHASTRAEYAEEAEVISVIRGMWAARSVGLEKVVVLTDCRRLVRAYELGSDDLSWGALTLAPDMLGLASCFSDFRFCYISRSLNFETHALAARGPLFPAVSIFEPLEANLFVNNVTCALCASSGILLGALTLPTVMLSRLIQLSRLLLSHHVQPQGEALLVTAGITLYFGDMLGYTLVKLETYLTSSSLASASYELKRSEISTIIQGVLAGLLLFPFLYKFILLVCSHCIFRVRSEASATKKKMSNGIAKSLVFCISLAVTLLVIVPAWMQFVQDFHMHPVSWVLNFVFTEPFKRIPLCIYWIGVICVSVLRFYSISKSSKIERILLRKYYHLMAVLMFLPALIFQPSFLDLAFGAALAVFLLLEIIRVWKIWPLGELVHQFMNAFTDHRDSDLLIVSHFSLLLGCAFPKWMSSGFNDRPLAPFAGILSLGIGDTMASIIGYKYGVLRWSKTGSTAAGITSVLAACSVLLPLLASTGFILSQHWLSLLLAVIVSGLLEAYTAQLDNAFIPLVFYSLLCL